MESSTKEGKSEAYCDICQHKHELVDASNVCRQCRLFFCPSCCSSHMNLSPSKDHVMIELGGVMRARDQAKVPLMHKIDNMASTASVADDIIVDSDYVCQEGLSTFLNAPEHASLSKIAEFPVPSRVQKILCFADGRICIHAENEIIIFSKEYHRQFATDCSPDCAVVHNEGNTIAILDYCLTIDRLSIKENAAKHIDNVSLDIPHDICELKATIKDLCGKNQSYPAFSFGNSQYALLFYEIEHTRTLVSEGNSIIRKEKQPPVWCMFNLAGKLLRRIYLPCSLENIGCIFHRYHNISLIDIGKLHECLSNTIRFHRFNRYGGTTYISVHGVSSSAVYTDGTYVLFYTRCFLSLTSNLVVLEIKTQKKRSFNISYEFRLDSMVFQESLNRIIVAASGTLEVFELS